MTAARPKRRRAASQRHDTDSQDHSPITSTVRKRRKGVGMLSPLRPSDKRSGCQTSSDQIHLLLQAGVSVHKVAQIARSSASRTHEAGPSPGTPSLAPVGTDEDDEVFSPAFHALPEDHSHLHVQDAPAASSLPQKRRSVTPNRVHCSGDENAEPRLARSGSQSGATATDLGAGAVGAPPMHMRTGEHDPVLAGVEEVMDVYAFIKNLPPLLECVSENRRILLPRQTRSCKQKTLVLDLDETLVHSSLDVYTRSDFVFPITLSNGSCHTAYVRMRPYLQQFLQSVSSMFEVVVFTASQRVYAEQLLNCLDPKKEYIRHRLYRDSCVVVEGNYMKDLTILGRDLQSTVIVDNTPQAFGFQLANGIPISSWYDDDNDSELPHLAEFLKVVASADDVRTVLQKVFKLQELVDIS